MVENLIVNSKLGKREQYEQLIPQVKALIEGEISNLANRANLCAAIKETFGFLWVGFYHVIETELVLGNFQGPVACTRIRKGKGVCGSSWERKEIIIVDDVSLFPGHIACNSFSKSEIAVPIFDKNSDVISIFDIDHNVVNSFDEIDAHYLQLLLDLLN